MSQQQIALTTKPASDSGFTCRVLVLCSPFPSKVDPGIAIFVKQRVKALASLPGMEVRVLSPVPWFPPLKQFPAWYRWSQFPVTETYEGLRVDRPRYFLLPRIGGYFHPRLMYPAAKRATDSLRRTFRFDVIDAHFVYPNGVVGAMLGKRYGVPVVMTGRGEDMLRFPNMPLKGRSIRWALRHGSRFQANSCEIAQAMIGHGADPARTTVIPNGVDAGKFRPLSQGECRTRLGLPHDRPMIISVGDCLELKGFHLLVDAMPSILEAHPGAMLLIVGGPGRHGRDYTHEIKERVHRHGLAGHVLLVGARPQDELPLWYSAADVFALLSSREGSSNALLEALACGLPAVGMSVGGIRDELQNPELGILLDERSARAAADAIASALSRNWDRNAIHHSVENRTWSATAVTIANELLSVIGRKPTTSVA